MSALISAFAAGAGAASFVQTALFQTQRAIASIIPNCAIEERHLDRLVVTQHPVEQSASISDHTYKMPSEVTLRWAWSNSPTLGSLLAGVTNGQGLVLPDIDQIYTSLLALQVSGEVFGLSTGKHYYPTMVLTSLMVTTDKDTEEVLMVTAVCTEVILVSTQAVNVAPLSSQTFPQQTGGVATTGAQTPTQVASPPSSSVLYQVFH
jgi:hypothetical protein